MPDHIRLLEHEYVEVSRLIEDMAQIEPHEEECECDCGPVYVGLDSSRIRLLNVVERIGAIYNEARARAIRELAPR